MFIFFTEYISGQDGPPPPPPPPPHRHIGSRTSLHKPPCQGHGLPDGPKQKRAGLRKSNLILFNSFVCCGADTFRRFSSRHDRPPAFETGSASIDDGPAPSHRSLPAGQSYVLNVQSASLRKLIPQPTEPCLTYATFPNLTLLLFS